MSDLQDPFRVVKTLDGRIGLIIKWRVTKQAKNFIAKNKFDYLHLGCTDPGGMEDLGFLVDHKEKILDLSIHNDEIDWDIINQLTSIRALELGGWFNCRGLDFRKLPSLAYLESYWNDGYEESLTNLKYLQCLKLVGCRLKSFSSFGRMPKLQYVSIYRATTPESLAGFELFPQLKHLHIQACSKLREIQALTACKKLQYLEIINCNRLNNGASISNIDKLSHLILIGKFNSVDWLKNMKHLYTLRMNCKLDDGNLDFLYKMKNLKFIDYNNKKNYTVKVKDIQKHLEEMGFNQKEAWSSHGLDFPDPKEFLKN